ncbi:MAG: hypothetical protein KBA40_01805 [Candidatus Peribacteraceae bacterium]|nr:hypothetical protein [Candidatus Peribacteraceae bacterium]
MSFGSLSRYRIVLAAVAGIAVALAAAAGIFLSLEVDPKTLHLSDRVDAKRALVYISSRDRVVFFGGVRRFETLMGDSTPTEQDIAQADRYEFALLQTGSGVTEWIIYGRNERDGSHTTVVSNNDPSLLLPLTERRQALSRIQLFQHLTKDESSFAWFDVHALPFPESTAATLARSLLSPYKEGLLIGDSQGKGRLILKGKTVQRTGALEMSTGDNIPVAGMSLGDPLSILSAMTINLKERDPALLEGLTGILTSRLQKWTSSTDLALLKGLLAGPVSLEMHQREEGRSVFAMSGTASENDTLRTILEKAASVMMEGSIRRIEFLDEYSRKDVTAATTSGLTDLDPHNGWVMKRLGGSGSDISLFAAQSGRKYVLGNDESLVKQVTGARGDDASYGSGSMDMTWVSSEIETRLPFLQPIRPTLETLLGPSPARLTWRISGISGGIGIEWTLTREPKNTRP